MIEVSGQAELSLWYASYIWLIRSEVATIINDDCELSLCWPAKHGKPQVGQVKCSRPASISRCSRAGCSRLWRQTGGAQQYLEHNAMQTQTANPALGSAFAIAIRLSFQAE